MNKLLLPRDSNNGWNVVEEEIYRKLGLLSKQIASDVKIDNNEKYFIFSADVILNEKVKPFICDINGEVYLPNEKSLKQFLKLIYCHSCTNFVQIEWDEKRNIASEQIFFQKQSSRGVLKIYSKFTGERLCQSVISIKFLCNFIEIALRRGCSPVNLLRFVRIPFYKKTYGGRLLLFFKVLIQLFWVRSLHILYWIKWKCIVIVKLTYFFQWRIAEQNEEIFDMGIMRVVLYKKAVPEKLFAGKNYRSFSINLGYFWLLYAHPIKVLSYHFLILRE